MSEAQEFVGVDGPCEECEVGAGVPCLPDCPALQAAGGWLGARSMDESLSRLAAAVHRLPYGAQVGLIGLGAPDRADYTPEEYVAKVADWMTEYQQVLVSKVDDLERQSRERIGLQIERDVFDGAIRRALEGV